MTSFRPTTLSPEALKVWDEADANIEASMQRIRELTAPLRRPGSAGLKEEALQGFKTVSQFVLGELEGTSDYEEYKKIADTVQRALEARPND